MNRKTAHILDKCLKRMEDGDSLANCLADYPEYAGELKPLLELSSHIETFRDLQPAPAFQQFSRRKIEQQLQTKQESVTFPGLIRLIKQRRQLTMNRRFQMAKIIVSVMLALAVATGGVAYASDSAHPGDFLYGVDLAVEQVQERLRIETASRLQTQIAHAEERLSEAQAELTENNLENSLQAMNRYAEQIANAARMIGSEDGANQEQLRTMLRTALTLHQGQVDDILEGLPVQTREMLHTRLQESAGPFGPPEEAGPPDEAGSPNEGGAPPDGAGPPEDGGPNDGAGPHDGDGPRDGEGGPNDGAGPYDGGGPNDGTGSGNGSGNHTEGDTTCESSLSEEVKALLLDLAEQYRGYADYDYVLSLYCAEGSIEQVEAILSDAFGPQGGNEGGSGNGSGGGKP